MHVVCHVLSKAAKMLLSTLQWRAGLHLAHPLRIEEFEAEIKSGKIYVCGNDPAGRSILVRGVPVDAVAEAFHGWLGRVMCVWA